MERDVLGKQEHIICMVTIVKRRKLPWSCDQVERGLVNTVLQGGTVGSRKRGRPAKLWIDNSKNEQSSISINLLRTTAEDRELSAGKPACRDTYHSVAPPGHR